MSQTYRVAGRVPASGPWGLINHQRFTAEEREAYKTCQAWLSVLQHRAIEGCVDLEVLQEIAENAQSERHRLRAASILQKARQQATESLARVEGHREEILKAKGLSQGSVEHTHKLDLGALDVEALRALASGTPPTIEVEATVVEPDDEDELLPDSD